MFVWFEKPWKICTYCEQNQFQLSNYNYIAERINTATEGHGSYCRNIWQEKKHWWNQNKEKIMYIVFATFVGKTKEYP